MTLHSADSTIAAQDEGGQLAALLRTAGVAQLDKIGWIRVVGEDRVRWLNGMVTNSIQELAPGQGCYSFVLNSQGRIQGDLTAFLLEDSILLEIGREQVETLLAHFNRFIIMDDVEVADISDQRKGLLIAGPDALRVIRELGGAPCSVPPPPTPLATDVSLKQTAYRGESVHLIKAHSPLIPRFEVWAGSEIMTKISAELALIPHITAQAIEQLRMLEGTPRYGVDIRNTETAHDLAQETGQTRALNFNKGCYLGQEIVERIHSRGNVHRTLSGFVLDGTLPPAGTALQSDGKAVGEVTSVAAIHLPESASMLGKAVQLAIGYVRREALDRSLSLEYPGGVATPIALPYAIE